MLKFGKAVVKSRFVILIVAVLLLIPAGIGYIHTKVNYDILSYLPKEIDTMKGQDMLLEKFGTGAYSFVVVDGMDNKDLKKTADTISDIPHVKKVIWYGSVMDMNIPKEAMPEKAYKFIHNSDKNADLMVILFDQGMAEDGTMKALDTMNTKLSKQCFVSGMASVINDTRNLSKKEVPIYVLIAVVLCLIVLMVTLDSAFVPFLFLISIGMAVVYNLGTNMIQGQISYVTQALAAVLQLGVTMDYSIFVWHSYEEQQRVFGQDNKDAMAHAISKTFLSIAGSSTTTIAGFIALCFMSFRIGLDLGVVMAKGVLFGLISCVTILPSLILVFDPIVRKTNHKVIMPDLGRTANWIVKHCYVFFVIFLILAVPAFYGQAHTKVYYDLAGKLPDSMKSKQANEKMNEDFKMGATSIIIADSSLSAEKSDKMISEIEDLKGIKLAMSVDSLTGPMIPSDVIPDDIRDELKSGDKQLMIVTSDYATATSKVNRQCTQIEKIIKKYDKSAMLIGEAPCTKDLVNITNSDFNRVNAVSIIIVFFIILISFRSISIPIILVAVIEFAIYINMGIPYYTHTTLPFIASIVIGTIQLGSTVDYAILMTNRYKTNRFNGVEKKEAITDALRGSISSIIASALTFFGATFGVAVYSDIDMISSLCNLMARGAIISMLVVIFLLPSMFMIFDKVIIHTSAGFINKNAVNTKTIKA
ncbi:MAG: MMPL family transporter [Lachnospiraceae bacterium]|nr:MMPL family transporter [Lachnospiraceae bacterium]MDY4164685.1 MMPL family transporter [Lachnospiraceae bacterium]